MTLLAPVCICIDGFSKIFIVKREFDSYISQLSNILNTGSTSSERSATAAGGKRDSSQESNTRTAGMKRSVSDLNNTTLERFFTAQNSLDSTVTGKKY